MASRRLQYCCKNGSGPLAPKRVRRVAPALKARPTAPQWPSRARRCGARRRRQWAESSWCFSEADSEGSQDVNVPEQSPANQVHCCDVSYSLRKKRKKILLLLLLPPQTSQASKARPVKAALQRAPRGAAPQRHAAPWWRPSTLQTHTHLETAGATILLLLCLAQQIQGAQGTKIANEARNYIVYDRPCAYMAISAQAVRARQLGQTLLLMLGFQNCCTRSLLFKDLQLQFLNSSSLTSGHFLTVS